MMNTATLLFIGWVFMALAMALFWEVQRRTRDAGIVDAVWAGGIGLVTVFFALVVEGYGGRRVAVAAFAVFWSFRLTAYLLRRVLRLPEDGRYRELRQKWGPAAQRNFFIFFQIQALWCLLFTLPMLVAMRNTQPFGWLDLLALVIWIVALTGETVSDRQLARFREDPATRGQVCRSGLWRYSRHPNYFFEWLHWWSYVCLGWGAPMGWVTLMGPLLMLLFILKITGIPPTEAHALASRGEAYREYQRTTSKFFPWPPRNRKP